jgi:hypothetical protein
MVSVMLEMAMPTRFLQVNNNCFPAWLSALAKLRIVPVLPVEDGGRIPKTTARGCVPAGK